MTSDLLSVDAHPPRCHIQDEVQKSFSDQAEQLLRANAALTFQNSQVSCLPLPSVAILTVDMVATRR